MSLASIECFKSALALASSKALNIATAASRIFRSSGFILLMVLMTFWLISCCIECGKALIPKCSVTFLISASAKLYKLSVTLTSNSFAKSQRDLVSSQIFLIAPLVLLYTFESITLVLTCPLALNDTAISLNEDLLTSWSIMAVANSG